MMNNTNYNPVQGLASLGRNNDTMLMHVTPDEVNGLQQIAMSMGGSLTINPHTGLPEAGFFDFIKNMLPTIAGLGVGMVGGPMAGAATAGALKTAQTGSLTSGIMTGLTSYMGGSSMQGLGDFGAGATGAGVTEATGEGALNAGTGNIWDAATNTGTDAALNAGTGNAWDPAMVADTAGVNSGAALGAGYNATLPIGDQLSNMGTGFGKMMEPGGFDAYAKSVGKSPMMAGVGLAAPVIGPAMDALSPTPILPEDNSALWGKFSSLDERRKRNAQMGMAEGGPIQEDGTGIAGLFDNRVGNEGEGGGSAEYFAEGGLKDGGFVIPADVVSHYGNGSTDAGLAVLHRNYGARPIRGAGDGMSDSIKTTIEGKQPARIANGEAYVPPEAVNRVGGAKKLYANMDKIRKARTGTTKQGKQIDPNKFMMS